jgi:ABC-type sugar transport system substrate-binding protein
VSQQLEWHETAPGLLYEAIGADGRRYVIAVDGQNWTLDLLVDGEYEAELAVDPAPAASLELAQQMAQEWERELW